MAYVQELDTLEERPAYLVYEINGKPLSYRNGYPVTAWFESATAADGRKQCTTINVVSGNKEDYGAANVPAYSDGNYENMPNVAFCQLRDGQVIKAYEPYTFEGYAQGFYNAVEAVEISFDQGVTWQRFDTSEATSDRWVYWKLTWTPPAEGSYVVSVRAIDTAGNVTTWPVEKMVTVK